MVIDEHGKITCGLKGQVLDS